MKGTPRLWVCLAGISIASSPAAADTTNYSYDALGRLVGSSVDRGFVVATSISYDPAGNRSSYQVRGAATSGMTAKTQSSTARSASPVSAPGVATYTVPAPAAPPVIAKALAENSALKRPAAPR